MAINLVCARTHSRFNGCDSFDKTATNSSIYRALNTDDIIIAIIIPHAKKGATQCESLLPKSHVDYSVPIQNHVLMKIKVMKTTSVVGSFILNFFELPPVSSTFIVPVRCLCLPFVCYLFHLQGEDYTLIDDLMLLVNFMHRSILAHILLETSPELQTDSTERKNDDDNTPARECSKKICLIWIIRPCELNWQQSIRVRCTLRSVLLATANGLHLKCKSQNAK